MNCLVCNSEMVYYFTKTFNKYDISDIEYWRCTHCGFVSSKKHREMSDEKFGVLNVSYHQSYQDKDYNPDDPRWLLRLNAQAEVIDDAARLGLIKADGKWVDYACGGGQLAKLLAANYGRSLLNYDKYMASQVWYISADLYKHVIQGTKHEIPNRGSI